MDLNPKNPLPNEQRTGGETSQTEASRRDKEKDEYQLGWSRMQRHLKWTGEKAYSQYIQRWKRKRDKRERNAAKQRKTVREHHFVWSRRVSRQRQKQTACACEEYHHHHHVSDSRKGRGLSFFKARARVCGAHLFWVAKGMEWVMDRPNTILTWACGYIEKGKSDLIPH